MTIISTVVITANQGADPVELLQHLGKGLAKIKSYEGVQEATLSAIAVGGAGTNSRTGPPTERSSRSSTPTRR